MNKNSLALFLLIPAALLIIAPLISFPYGFYTLLRLIVSVTAGFIIYHSYKGAGGVNEISIIFAVILILYNPIAPVHLSREIWMPINFITAGIYIYGFFKIKKQIQMTQFWAHGAIGPKRANDFLIENISTIYKYF